MHDGRFVWPMLALTFSACSVQLFHLFSSFFHLHVRVERGASELVHQNQDPPGSRISPAATTGEEDEPDEGQQP